MYAGKCFCLYQEDTSLPVESVPHILESDITSTVLFLKRMEIAGLSHCDFIDRPGEILLTPEKAHSRSGSGPALLLKYCIYILISNSECMHVFHIL